MNKTHIATTSNCDALKNSGLPVIIFGSGIVGEVLFHACKQQQIKVECFCDNNVKKTDKLLHELPIIQPDKLKEKYPDAYFLISAADIGDVVEQLHCLGYSKWRAAPQFLKNFNLFALQLSTSGDFAEYAVATCLLCHDSYLHPRKLFLRSVDIIITEHCSLKCKDCSNLMQYYANPKNCDIDSLFKSVDAFCDTVDEVNEFRVIGGEPLMNQKCHLIVEKLISKEHVKKIVVYTNGTIVPSEDKLERFKSRKVLFIITDYGILSRKLEQLVAALSRHGILYHVFKASGWTDCSRIKKHNRSLDELKNVFRACCARNTFTLSDGRLYRCPFAANAARLAAVPDSENDYIDIIRSMEEGIAHATLKKNIGKYLREKTFLKVCDYCNGRGFDAPEIPPAIQVDTPLAYLRYDD